MDYDLDVLPFQEDREEQKPIQLKIDEEGLSMDKAKMDPYANHDGDLGDTGPNHAQ